MMATIIKECAYDLKVIPNACAISNSCTISNTELVCPVYQDCRTQCEHLSVYAGFAKLLTVDDEQQRS